MPSQAQPTRRRGILLVSVMLVGALIASRSLAGDQPNHDATDFFERRVRPVLVGHCLKCHGPETQESGLRLDSRDAALRGGSRGVAVVLGNADQSLLIQALRRDGELKMPPSGPLKPAEVAAIERWIQLGAPWPQAQPALTHTTSETQRKGRIDKLRDGHWALQPIRKPNVPKADDAVWVRNAIDHFILARLNEGGLSPSPEARRSTLVRRLYFDLIGLPPGAGTIEAFAIDSLPNAYEKLVDQLLNRPEYGQRWARHWLDVARYADTTGYQEGAERRYPFAWTYRDYVVRSFNEDTPYDQFIVEQLAADQLDLAPEERWKLAARGFLTLGPRFNYVRHEIIDDRIDVVTRGLMGLTVACARCHDHKYDPVLADDYYALYGVFASLQEPLYTDLPRIGPSRGDFGRYRRFRRRAAQATREFEQLHRRSHRRVQHEMRALVGDYLRYLVQLMPEHRTVSQLTDLKQRDLLKDTLVVWGGEFGRTPTAQGGHGRDHNHYGFSMWLAGGGVKGGTVYGATDEFGWKAVENPVHVHDLHATILHLFGLDHERLTYRHAGRDFRLTDVYGRVIDEIVG